MVGFLTDPAGGRADSLSSMGPFLEISTSRYHIKAQAAAGAGSWDAVDTGLLE
jgi:hypothetical protein